MTPAPLPPITDLLCYRIAFSATYYDASAPANGSKWSCVDVKLVEKWLHPVYLPTLKSVPALANMQLFKQNRLSVSEVTKDEWNIICKQLRQK